MEPPVSVPVAAKAALAATAAADPPDDPPGVLFSSKFHGLITVSYTHLRAHET